MAGQEGGLFRKILGSTFTFVYVYLWHGKQYFILLWSLFNYLAIVAEILASHIGSYPLYMNLENRIFAAKAQRRFHALLGAFLFVGSSLAAFYFFMGALVGNYFVYRVFSSSPFEMYLVLFFAYCAAQFSIEVKNWELRNEIRLRNI